MQTQNPLTQKPEVSAWFSAPVILFFWILFFPIGIYLTYKRGALDKKASIIIGRILVGIGVFWSIGAIVEWTSPELGSHTFTVFAILNLGIGIYNIKYGKRCMKYISLIGEQDYRSLEEIAAQTGMRYHTVKLDIRKLLKAGYFRDHYLNEESGCLEAYSDKSSKREAKQSAEEPLYAVNCKSCGAPQNVKKGNSRCEYCGSTINV